MAPPSPLPRHLYKILKTPVPELPSADLCSCSPSTSLLRSSHSLPSTTVLPATALDKRDNFIHLSTKAQVAFVLNRFFKEPSQIALVKIAYAALDAAAAAERQGNKAEARVQWDEVGHGSFAHVYGMDIRGESVVEWAVLRQVVTDVGREWEGCLSEAEMVGFLVD